MSRSAEAWRSARSNSTGKPFFLYEKVSSCRRFESMSCYKILSRLSSGERERERERDRESYRKILPREEQPLLFFYRQSNSRFMRVVVSSREISTDSVNTRDIDLVRVCTSNELKTPNM